MKKTLSKTMLAAVALAKLNEGKLYRHSGGFWAGRAFRLGVNKEWFDVGTIEALRKRGVLTVTAEKGNRQGTFWTEVTLTNP